MTHARILTLNVQNLEGDPRRQEMLQKGIEELQPDLVSLQEVVASPERDQLADLLSDSGLSGAHQAQTLAYEPPWAARYGGTALASRWPFRVVEALDLRQIDATDVPWCTLAAVVEVPEAGEMLFIATTASWRLDASAARERQALAVADLDSRQRRVVPSVIAGDLNADPDAASIRFLTGRQSLAGQSVYYQDAWAARGEGPGYTWTCDNPAAHHVMEQMIRQESHRHRFDYVLVGSAHTHTECVCRIVSARLAFDHPNDGVWASDHFGVVVDVEIDTVPSSAPATR